jgi:ubiquinone/menaquinone biosynthesis C-methylase UbiE
MRETFNRIAPGWYNYRHWSIFRTELETLAQRWQGGRLLNLGCAHGPDFLPFISSFELHGVDFSPEMLRLAGDYSQKFDFDAKLVLADITYLPYADSTFDRAISVATYHHLKKKEQTAALNELRRVLNPGGEVFITVWNRWQPRFWLKGKEPVVTWKTGGETLYRYYYLFSYPELLKLVKQAGFKVLGFPEGEQFPARFFSRNLCLLVTKE